MTDTETTITGEVAAATAILRDIAQNLDGIAQNLDGIAEEIASIRDNTESIRAHISARDLRQVNASTPGDYGSPQNPREGVQQPRGAAFTPTPPTRTGDTVDAPQNATQEFRVGDRVRILAPGTWADGIHGAISRHVGETGIVVEEIDSDGDVGVKGDGWEGAVALRHLAHVDPEPEGAPQDATQESIPWPQGADGPLFWVRGQDAGADVQGVAVLLDDNKLISTNNYWQVWQIWRISLDKADRLYECVPVTPVPTELIDRLAAEVSKFAWPKDLRFASSPIGGAAAEIVRWLDHHEEARR